MKILTVTDLNSVGSGYASLTMPLLVGLSNLGHEVKVIGLANNGSQHNFDFSIFPAKDTKEVEAMIHNLMAIWPYDVLLVLMDIPFHKGLLNRMQGKPFKYVGVFPVEADPLSFGWAMVLMQMDKQFVISEFGTQECHKRGIMTAEHLPVGVDTQAWRMPLLEEKKALRSAFGFSDDTFVVLTVADNQERKNLPACFKAFSLFSKKHPDSKYLLVTREHLFAGWNLQELASEMGILDKLLIFERGISFKELWMLYAVSNAFLLLSKAEGLGMPVVEAMSVGLPVVGTDCTGIQEQIKDNRGYPVVYEYSHIDPFGNANRYWADASVAALALESILSDPETVQEVVKNAYVYAQDKNWDKAVLALDTYLKGIENE